jgi:hypothetical protein
MSAIRIPRLGENKEVQAKVTFPKRLYDLLIKYAEAYEAAYGEKVQPEKLVPVIVEDYLRKDHGFKKYLSKNTQKDNTQSPVEKKETKQKPLAA